MHVSTISEARASSRARSICPRGLFESVGSVRGGPPRTAREPRALPGCGLRGFTLIELLVVITVIAILIGLLFPAFRGVQDQAKRTQAKNDLTQIVTAVNAFYTEYGKYPIAPDDNPLSATNRGNLMYTLRAVASGANANNAVNTRQIVFISPPDAKDQTTPRSGIKTSDGQWYDPWNTPYNIAIDADYNNQITNPYGTNGGAGASPLSQGVLAWSYGSDQQSGTGGNNVYKDTSGVQSDDVISWQ